MKVWWFRYLADVIRIVSKIPLSCLCDNLCVLDEKSQVVNGENRALFCCFLFFHGYSRNDIAILKSRWLPDIMVTVK